MEKIIVLLLTCTLFLFSSCAEDQHHSNVSLSEFKQHVQQEELQKQDKQQIWDYAIPVTDGSEYLIQTGDLVTVSVFEIDELQTTARINSRGYVQLPLLEGVVLKGLSAAEAEEKIENLLKRDYMHNPHVTVILNEMVGQQVTAVGAVSHPGTFVIQSQKTILDILALAEGLADNASDVAYVTRKDKGGGKNKVFLVNLHQLINKGQVDMNVQVKGGDVIFVPEAGVVSVDGAVKKPGTVYLEGEMTINEAIASAGGTANYADLEDIKLIRVMESGEREIVQLSIGDIAGASRQELLLREDDIVFVEASGSKVFSSGFSFDIGFMGTGIKYDSPIQ